MQSFKKLMSSSSSSAEVIGHNQDLMTQIAVYLPIKSILRFRSVSKQWNSLLTHPDLALSYKSKKCMLYLQRSASRIYDPDPKPKYLYLEHNQNIKIADFNYLQIPSQESIFLENSCNGLLLVQSVIYKDMHKHKYTRRTFYVCNPSTRKHSKLVLPDFIATASRYALSSCLAFDPLVSPYYKVIFFLRYRYKFSNFYNIYIYSSETKRCTILQQIFEGVDGYRLCTGVFFNGSICWATDLPYDMTLNYFDIKHESFHVFPNPPLVGNIGKIKYFGESIGRLNIILADPRQPLQGVVDVYELKEDYSSWVFKYKVDIESISVGFPEISMNEQYSIYYYMCCLEDEGEEEPTLVVCVGDKILLAYNLINNTTKKLGNLPCCKSYSIKLFHCLESLFGV